jgi:hypothetical protein
MGLFSLPMTTLRGLIASKYGLIIGIFGDAMGWSSGRSLNVISKFGVATLLSASIAYGQAPPAQSMALSTEVSTEAVPSSASATPNVEPNGIAPEISDTAIDPASLLPDLPSLPTKKTTLIGGTIDKLDRVRDQFTVRIFGGGKMKIFFDPRTHIYRDGSDVSASELRAGDHVYVDTILNGSTVFARNIRLKTAAAGESEGYVVSYRSDNGELILRDAISPKPLKLKLTPQTRLNDNGRSVAATTLIPGTLVTASFGPQQDGRALAREISILAIPGGRFTFVGKVTGLDLSASLLTLTSSTDGKSYEIFLDPSAVAANDTLRQAADVTVLTLFDGHRYVAKNVTVN